MHALHVERMKLFAAPLLFRVNRQPRNGKLF
jgi:hypothetical protein